MKEYDYYSWTDFVEAAATRQVVIWGASETGIKAIEELKEVCTIIGVVDKSQQSIGKKINGYQVQLVEDICKMKNEIVVVIAHQYVYPAIANLRSMGIPYYFHYETMKYNKEHRHDCQFRSLHKYKYDWIEQGCYAHGMGMIDGFCLTNSLEAFKLNYERGYRIFECDIDFVESEAILCHVDAPFENMLCCKGDSLGITQKNTYNSIGEDGGPISFAQLKREKIYGKYTPLRFADLLNLLKKEYPDVKIIPDVSHAGGAAGLLRLIEQVENFDPAVLEQFIFEINVEEKDFVDIIKERVKNCSMMLIHDHRQFVENRYTDIELIQICANAGIGLLMVGIPRISRHLIEVAKSERIKIGAYCWINDKESIRKLKEIGVSFFCTESQLVADI